MSKHLLATNFMLGIPVTLFCAGRNLWLNGIIQGITLESGFTAPNTPHHFNVMLKVSENGSVVPSLNGQCVEVYVNTID